MTALQVIERPGQQSGAACRNVVLQGDDTGARPHFNLSNRKRVAGRPSGDLFKVFTIYLM